MNIDWKKKLLASGMTIALTVGALAGCGDGVDQDNGISDGEQKDQLDNDNKQTNEDIENDMQDSTEDAQKKLQENGIGDGVDQDNGISDGEKKDELDNKNPEE
ncbi:hypothetical protein [Metabacillus fastidiosus]|uniref:Lipoprotein n=1 Tax=Metabacillus fastidiosus TaxID=1458 RepID=A0ABU6NTU9_9BACI|nr:hypothetical protein [Metabacillus fastidiosus]MED4400568.1 hypothetical protein [Metabacillus fastidiosus]MED4455793.1 hypothetical protein [Metabacillus fastidiosus]MED4464537.1 hypothetical protein [Metabacillus fastidiosus]